MTSLPLKQREAINEYKRVCGKAEGPPLENYKIQYPPYICITEVLEATSQTLPDSTALLLKQINDLDECAFLREEFNENLKFCQDDIDRGHEIAPKIAREKRDQCQFQFNNIEIYTKAFNKDATNQDIDRAIDFLDNTDTYLLYLLSRLDSIHFPTINEIRQRIDEKKSILLSKKIKNIDLAAQIERERKLLEEMAEERRQRELAEQKRQRKIAEEKTQLELAEQERTKHEKKMQVRISRKLALSSKKNNDSPLMQAIQDGDSDLVDYLISKDMYINDLNKFNQNALHYAAKKGNTQLIVKLISKNANNNQLDIYDNVPLQYAPNIESVYAMINFQDFLNTIQTQLQTNHVIQDSSGNNLLHNTVFAYSTISNNMVLKPSLKKTILDQITNQVITPLNTNTDLELFWQQNNMGFTPLHYANSPEIIYVLMNFQFYKDLVVDQSSSTDITKDSDGNNLLHWIIDLYYQIHTNDRLQENLKKTVLNRFETELVKPLIENTELLWTENNEYVTPYDQAVNYNLFDFYEYMVTLDDKKIQPSMSAGRDPLRPRLSIIIPKLSDEARNNAIIEQITRNNPLLASFHPLFERIRGDPGIASTIDSLLVDAFEGSCGSFTSADIYHILWRESVAAQEPSNLALAMIQYGLRFIPTNRQNIFMNILGAWYDRRIQGNIHGKMEFIAFVKCINRNPQIMIDLLKEAIDIEMSQRFSRASSLNSLV